MAELAIIEPSDIQIVSGTQPEPDRTNLASVHFTSTDKVRFYDGYLENVGGCEAFDFDNNAAISGMARAMYSQRISSNNWLLIGTHSKLYTLVGTELTNMTPSVAAASATTLGTDPLANDYNALGTDPLTMVDGSDTVTVALTGHKYVPGDTVEISGISGTVNGIPDTELNATHIVRTTPDANSFTIDVATEANADASGGGASVVCVSGVIRITDTAHSLDEGERITLSGATGTFGGVSASSLNAEHIIRNAQTNTYDVVIIATPTSSATGGGSAVDRQEEIADGEADAYTGRGFGMGKFGIGKFGVSKTSSKVVNFPRVWSFDRYGANIVMTEGDQGGVYEWDGSAGSAPSAITNAPTDVDYVFTSDNIIVTLGQGGVENRIKWSDQGNKTVWTATAQNQAGEDDIEGAGKFISQININGINLLFCEDQLWTMRYVGRPNIWRTRRVQGGQGIIAPQARCQLNSQAFWMGQNDFYMWNGSAVIPIPGNGSNGLNTTRRYIFKNLNRNQKTKCFAWANDLFNEVWFHFPTGDSAEPNEYVILSLNDFSWTLGTWERISAEYPAKILEFPRMVDEDGVLYRHEKGSNDDDAPLNPFARTGTRRLGNGKNNAAIHGIIPDTIQTGNIDFKVYTKDFPKEEAALFTTKTITPTTKQVDFQVEAKLWEYEISQSALNASMRVGNWQELLALGAPN